MVSRRGVVHPHRHDPVTVDVEATRPSGFQQLLRTGNFRLLWFSGALSAIGLMSLVNLGAGLRREVREIRMPVSANPTEGQ